MASAVSLKMEMNCWLGKMYTAILGGGNRARRTGGMWTQEAYSILHEMPGVGAERVLSVSEARASS